LLRRCPADLSLPYVEAIRLVNASPNSENEFLFLRGYGALCSLLPELHRPGLFEIAGGRDEGFRATFVTNALARSEARDRVLGDLVRGTSVGPLPIPARELDRSASAVDLLEACRGLRGEAKKLREAHVALVDEGPVLTEAGYLDATGQDRKTYLSLRGAVLALADCLVGIEHRRWSMAERMPQEAAQRIANAMVECASPVWLWTHLVEWLADVAEIDAAAVEALLTPFSLRVGVDEPRQRLGDGLFPPFVRVDHRVNFTSDLMRRYVHDRNMLWVLQREDTQRFDDLVSAAMEPHLIDEVVSLLDAHTDLVICRAVRFTGSELDLLLYDTSSNTAMQVQAKAPMPPGGARMTQANGARAMEGLTQLKVFRQLPSAERDAVISRAVGRHVSDVRIIDGLLMRTCLGRPDVWEHLGDAAPLNRGLLALLIAKARRKHQRLDLARLPQAAETMLDHIASDVGFGFRPGSYELDGVRLEVPVPVYDWDELLRWRQRAAIAARDPADPRAFMD
jgi:hypothetical protein